MRWEVVPDEPENRFGHKGNPGPDGVRGPDAIGVSGVPGNQGTPGYLGYSVLPGQMSILNPSPEVAAQMRTEFADAEDQMFLELVASTMNRRRAVVNHEVERVLISAGRRAGRVSFEHFLRAIHDIISRPIFRGH